MIVLEKFQERIMKNKWLLILGSVLYLTGCGGSGDSETDDELLGLWERDCILLDFSYHTTLEISRSHISSVRKVYDSDACNDGTLYAEENLTYTYQIGEILQDSLGNDARAIDMTLVEGSTYIVDTDEERSAGSIGKIDYRMYNIEDNTLYLSIPDMENNGDTPETRETILGENNYLKQ